MNGTYVAPAPDGSKTKPFFYDFKHMVQEGVVAMGIRAMLGIQTNTNCGQQAIGA